MNRNDIKALASGNNLSFPNGLIATVHAIDIGQEMITLKYVASPQVAPEDIPPPITAVYDPTSPIPPTKAPLQVESPAMLTEEGWNTTVICKWIELANANMV